MLVSLLSAGIVDCGGMLEGPSISSTVDYKGVGQPVKRRARPREPEKLWLVLSCVDSRGCPPLFLSINNSRLNRECKEITSDVT